ncbi:MAG TPA: DUF4185 domain-containing protein, partial [Acidimicrobiales bacterium]|nr:DUF4185 domain-containing protein [Acidimicrobiales bacterium]
MWHNGRGLRAKVLGATTLAGLLGLSLAGIGPASAQSSAATPLALENGWSPAPGTDRPAYSVAGNVVHLNGGLNGGQVRQTIATLPAGLRPAADEWYSVVTAANVVAPLVVHPNGDIVLNAGDPRFLSLSGIAVDIGTATPYQPLALRPGWSPAWGTYGPGYIQEGSTVDLTGGVNGGQVRQTVATLPAGLRPPADEWFSVVTAANVVAPLVVHPNGDIVLNAGDPRFLSLSGIHVLIGSPPPVNLALQNGWHRAWGTNGPGQTTSAGETALRGGLNGGTTRQTVTTLPSGSRPGADQWFTAVTANNVVAPVVVHATGDLVLNAGNPGFLSLEGIRVTDARPVGPPFVVNHADTYQVAQETGTGSINNTASRWDVYGSDLGNMFTYQGHTYLAFGDTFGGPAADPFFSVPHADWRSNTMAYDNSTAPPTGGIPFSGMITDAPGHAKELLSSLKQPGVEQTVIPTYGVAVGNRMYLYYMSVRSYGAPGHWTLNYSGIAYSDNGGQTW